MRSKHSSGGASGAGRRLARSTRTSTLAMPRASCSASYSGSALPLGRGLSGRRSKAWFVQLWRCLVPRSDYDSRKDHDRSLPLDNPERPQDRDVSGKGGARLHAGGYAFAPLAGGAAIAPWTVTILSTLAADVAFGEVLTRSHLAGAALVLAGIGMFVAAGVLNCLFTTADRSVPIGSRPPTTVRLPNRQAEKLQAVRGVETARDLRPLFTLSHLTGDTDAEILF
jgi:hypothetical protein